MSVGNPGKGAVVRLTAFGCVLRMSSMRPRGSILSRAPASRNFSRTASPCCGSYPISRIRPRVAAAAKRYVPASIRSEITVWQAPCSASTPLTVITSVPAPSMIPPIAIKQRAKSTTSGSRAAFSKTVIPRARTAAINRFSVPVTVTVSNNIRAPLSPPRPTVALIYPFVYNYVYENLRRCS